jgi:hypothetical protein
LASKSGFMRLALRLALAWRASAAATSASARATTAWNGTGSMVKSDCPARTGAPSS